LSDRGTCIVDDCMKYEEVSCSTEHLSNCVILDHNDENWCVSGECSILGTNNDCEKNDVRCRVVKNVCVENPCVDIECNSPACKMISDKCVYDECSQFIPSGTCWIYSLSFIFYLYS
jgi:hypothetical protein